MIQRKELFPNVIELNFQARRRLGCCVYLIFDGNQWGLIDIGYEDTVDEIIELIRQMDFPLAGCELLVATHADIDHIQGMKKAQDILANGKLVGHPEAKDLLKKGDRIITYAEIGAQDISMNLPKIKIDQTIDEGDEISIGSLKLEVWHTPGHTNSQLAFRMGKLLFSGDNLFRDGGVGNIDAHHGSNIPDFINSLERIKKSDVEWLLPSHGPAFKKNDQHIQKTIDRLTEYLHMPDFGTCAIDWPLLDEWEAEIEKGILPEDSK